MPITRLIIASLVAGFVVGYGAVPVADLVALLALVAGAHGVWLLLDLLSSANRGRSESPGESRTATRQLSVQRRSRVVRSITRSPLHPPF